MEVQSPSLGSGSATEVKKACLSDRPFLGELVEIEASRYGEEVLYRPPLCPGFLPISSYISGPSTEDNTYGSLKCVINQ